MTNTDIRPRGASGSAQIDLQEQVAQGRGGHAAQHNVSAKLDGNQFSSEGAAAGIVIAADKDALAPALGNDAGFIEEAGYHLDGILTQALAVSAKRGAPAPVLDEEIAAPFIPGSAALSETKPDEEGLKPLDTEEA